jgi:single-strand DNA-binding protein
MEIEGRNEVVLVGRIAAKAEQRELPSGDLLTSWRLVVDRGPTRRPVPDGIRPPSVDTLECVAWSKPVQRSASAWEPGDVVEVEGALRRRFWRAPTGASSRYEVEVSRAKRLARAA